MKNISKQIDEFVIKKRVDNFVNKGAWSREQEQILDYGKKPAPMPKDLKRSTEMPNLTNVKNPANPHVLTLPSQNIKKYKRYLKPGEKPPQGQQMMRGRKGSYFYETGNQGGRIDGLNKPGVPPTPPLKGKQIESGSLEAKALKRAMVGLIGDNVKTISANKLYDRVIDQSKRIGAHIPTRAGFIDSIKASGGSFEGNMIKLLQRSEPSRARQIEQSRRAFAPGGIQERFNRRQETSRM